MTAPRQKAERPGVHRGEPPTERSPSTETVARPVPACEPDLVGVFAAIPDAEWAEIETTMRQGRKLR